VTGNLANVYGGPVKTITLSLACSSLLFVGCGEPVAGESTADALVAISDVIESDQGEGESPADVTRGSDGTGSEADGDVVDPDFVPAPPESCVVFTPDAQDPSAAVFDSECVIDVRVELEPKDWNTLRLQTRSILSVVQGECSAAPPEDVFSWFEADVTVGGQRVEKVAIRKKGFLGSLSADKPSLKVRFDKYVDDQRLAGLKRMTLNNLNQDPSLINTCMAYGVMAQAGLPAPRCNFARVSVNGSDLGVYAHVDSIKKPFIARHFTSDEGNLYEATLSDFTETFRGTWEKKTNETENDWSDIDAAVAALAMPDEELMPALEAVFDLNAFYTHWATEVLIGHWDGYAGNLNNTYVYADPADGLFRFIPWGADSAFVEAELFIGLEGKLPDGVYAFGQLAHRLYGHGEGRAAYVARMKELLEDVWDATALVEELDRLEELLAPHLSGSAQGALAPQIQVKRSWINGRAAVLQEELLEVSDWPYPPRDPLCWLPTGSISGSFTTTWGSSGWDFLTQIGKITHDVALLDNLGNIAANARDGVGNTEGQAIVELIGNDLDGGFIVLFLFGDPELIQPDSSVPIDWLSFSGVIGRFEFLHLEFELIGILVDGTLSFEAASTYPGELVTGSFSADVIEPP
jgi:spore coat protein CotH